MDKINNINGIVSILRKKNGDTASVKAKSTTEINKTADVKVESKDPLSQEQLIKTIQFRISKIDKKNKNYRDMVMAIMAESIITWEFGENIMNDPGFETLVSNAIDGYQSEPSIYNKINKFIDTIS